jgi:hypothetical protein
VPLSELDPRLRVRVVLVRLLEREISGSQKVDVTEDIAGMDADAVLTVDGELVDRVQPITEALGLASD